MAVVVTRLDPGADIRRQRNAPNCGAWRAASRRATGAAGTAGHRERRVLPRRSRRLASNHGPSGVTALFSLFFVCVLSYRTPSREDAKTAVNANV
jgi:hypothetical protein